MPGWFANTLLSERQTPDTGRADQCARGTGPDWGHLGYLLPWQSLGNPDGGVTVQQAGCRASRAPQDCSGMQTQGREGKGLLQLAASA